MIAHPSPNFGPRPDGVRPDLIVLHYTAMPTAEAALNTLSNPDNEVSAHYLISEEGQAFRLVPEEMRAWHAGAGRWGAVTDVNNHSIGIELANDGFSPYSMAQMDRLIELIAEVRARWNIPPERVIGHSDMAPERKIDPGDRFDWQRLAREGQSVWFEDSSPQDTPEHFLPFLRRFGYTSEVAPEMILRAFRTRFRPEAKGPVDPTDIGIAADLAHRFPVDAAILTA